jgi:hypothetical protein
LFLVLAKIHFVFICLLFFVGYAWFGSKESESLVLAQVRWVWNLGAGNERSCLWLGKIGGWAESLVLPSEAQSIGAKTG